ncbi:hypothetical protein A2U01_0017841 [Trifolium medium]|uniref:Uncharacterized protein n=1 Tax=Trifolium medium TaxID=97028 RepID=A0A392NBL0_9FABA|nr:hypothetical protein [Trifolium medium]
MVDNLIVKDGKLMGQEEGAAALRKQQQLARNLYSRNSQYFSSKSAANKSVASETTQHAEQVYEAVTRTLPTVKDARKISSHSVSSAGEIMCCSSINSSDIRNCNKKFLKSYDREVVSKFWRGALELGVEVTSNIRQDNQEAGAMGEMEEECLQEIQDNEKRDSEERIRREQRQHLHK